MLNYQRVDVELLSKSRLFLFPTRDIAGRSGLEILLDHWLHQCTGLSDSHPSRGDSKRHPSPLFFFFDVSKVEKP